MKTTRLIVAITALALAAAACGDDDAATTTTAPPIVDTTGPGETTTTAATTLPDDGAVVIEIRGFAFSPTEVTVSVGDTVRWVNFDSTEHTTTSNGGEWDALLGNGETFEYVADTAGEFSYVCTLHMGMAATLTVEG